MRILLCIASTREVNEAKIATELRNGSEFVFRYTGVGVKNLRAIKDEIFTGNYDLVINAGVAGILNDSFQIFDVVVPYRYIFTFGGKVRELQFPSPRVKKWKTGCIVTTTRPITNERKRQNLRKRFGADIVDMESYYLADLTRERGIPFYSIKVLTDRANSTAVVDCLRNLKKAREILSDTIPIFINAIDAI